MEYSGQDVEFSLTYYIHFSVWLSLYIYIAFLLFRAAAETYENSQARSRIEATASGQGHSHSNTGSEQHLQPTPGHMATLDL